ncbi:uncharacterized protein LOC118773615 [Megalops cyprinoides]|uniref:uncharacterized protein LOC118773615 n=1 Tax=Megalops cyprinoides TaxID=118141 RepID=UPI00186562DC|nr:uncharacterized protein LOC118773615 [Megalops cyprinoides]
MEGALLLCLLCLQGSLLVSTLNCADKGISKQADEYRKECVTGDATKALPGELRVLKPPAPSGELQEPSQAQLAERVRRQDEAPRKRRKQARPGAFSTNSITWNPEGTKKPPTSREKRQLDSEWARSKKSHLPGAVSVTGRPMRPMQTDRARRHLPANKKVRGKPRVGSLSLLSNKTPTHLQITRVRRQLQNERKKKNPGRPGTFSPLGKPGPPAQGTRVRRQLQNERKKKNPGRPGTFSALGRPGPPAQGQRTKRNLQSKKKKPKKIVCS